MIKKLSIEGMNCNHCVMHVTNALKEVNGVNAVEVSLANKLATVEVNESVSNQDLINAVTEAGYEVIKIE